MTNDKLTWQEAFENETPVYIEFVGYCGHISWVYGVIVGHEGAYLDEEWTLMTGSPEIIPICWETRIDVDLGDGFADINAKDIVSIAPSRRRITDGN